ncbi:MAG: PEGA domain-containing protein, partial [Candidatus Eremiobacteraeota bacterium]|nr:PEGA domain-containing protein [Candidatus Eremiobacteraeota bacterium]
MRSRAIFASVICFGMLACPIPARPLLAAAAAAAAPATENAAIYVVTLPAGADIWVDGAYVGRTPVLVDGLPGGRHMITAAKTGWDSHEVDVKVGGALPFQFVDFALERSSRAPRADGKIAIHSAVPFEDLTLDGVPVKTSTAGTLDAHPGPHDVGARLQQHKIVRRVVVYPETTTNVVLREAGETDERAGVLAPAANYLPPSDVTLDGARLIIRHNGH